jgi:CspA family cold shock protein
MFGIVRSWSRLHGYGFIVPDGEDEPDRFVLYCWIQANPSRRFLKVGQRVEFDPYEENGRPQARNVRKLDEAAPTPMNGGRR